MGGGGPPPTWQFAVAGYVPLLSGNLSLIGSSLIVYSVVGTAGRREKLKKPHLRLLLGMSCWDVVYSFFKGWIFLFAPAGYGVPGALGNMRTCRLQGFFLGLCHCVGGYNALLSTYYWLTVCRGVKNEKWVRFEPLMHVGMPAFFVTLAAIAVWQKLYNPLFSFCYLAAYPPGCETSPDAPACMYGHHQKDMPLNMYMFSNLYLQFYVLWVCLTNFFIWWKVYKQERANRRYTAKIEKRAARESASLHFGANSSIFGFVPEPTAAAAAAAPSPAADAAVVELGGGQQRRGSTDGRRESGCTLSTLASISSATASTAAAKRQMSRDKQVLIQSVLYAGCFVLSWMGPVLFHLVDWIRGVQSFTWVILIVIFTPMQGFFNAFVYGRPTFIRIRRKYPHVTRWDAFKRIFFAEDPMAAVCSTDGRESTPAAAVARRRTSPSVNKGRTVSGLRAEVLGESKCSSLAVTGSLTTEAVMSDVIPEEDEEEQQQEDDDDMDFDFDFDPNDPACSQVEEVCGSQRPASFNVAVVPADVAEGADTAAAQENENEGSKNDDDDGDEGKTSDPLSNPTIEIQYVVESARSLGPLEAIHTQSGSNRSNMASSD